MALSQSDRIAFSKKIVEADEVLKTFDKSQQQLQAEKEKAQAVDDAHKNLIAPLTALINGYQNEIAQLDGNIRTQVIESELVDSAKMVYGNIYYPNVPGGTPPSINPNVWTKTKPYAISKMKGLTYNEAFAGTTPTEQSKINAIKTAFTAVETFADIERTTGQTCYNGFCSIPIHLTMSACIGGGGVWTPGPPDNITTYPAVVTALNNLVTAINDYKTFLLAEQPLIVTFDTDTTRQAQNNAAISSINTVLSIINTWLTYNDFDSSHGQTTCAGFFAYNVALLSPTKLRPTEYNVLKNAILTRESYLPTRISQLNNNLGNINQNLSTGDITGSGLYFARALYLNLRLAMLGGSLIDLLGYDKAIEAQNELKANIISAKNTYLSLMECTILTAPANDTTIVHVQNSSGFNVGDTVYIVSDTQNELVRNIVSIDGNRIKLSQPVPSKYRRSEYARMYKEK